jgi:hypothetical protein
MALPTLHSVVQPGPLVPGHLTSGWRVVTGTVWGLAFVCFIAVWKTSRELGVHTWWLGPAGEPAAWPVSLLPFVGPIAMIVLAVNNVRWIPWFGLAATAASALVAVPDVAKAPRLAVVEFSIATAGALASIAGLSGRYRAVPDA